MLKSVLLSFGLVAAVGAANENNTNNNKTSQSSDKTKENIDILKNEEQISVDEIIENRAIDINGNWAKDTINEFIDKEYIKLGKDKKFRPKDEMTCAEFVQLCNRYFGLTTTSGQNFASTKEHWVATDIDIAITNGLILDVTQKFEPDAKITREQASIMITNYLQNKDSEIDMIKSYPDYEKITQQSESSIEAMFENNYMVSHSDGYIKPDATMTRSEAVVTLNRINQGINDNETPKDPVVYYSYEEHGFKEVVFNEMLRLVNEYREENKLHPMVADASLQILSYNWSKYMVDNNFFMSQDPSTGKQSDEIFTDYGIWQSQNIAYNLFNKEANDKSAKELALILFEKWKNADNSNINILNPEYTSFGFGFYTKYEGNKKTIYAVQQFK